jgi:hypothetical protein
VPILSTPSDFPPPTAPQIIRANVVLHGNLC